MDPGSEDLHGTVRTSTCRTTRGANFLICNAGGGIFPATTVAAGVVNFNGCNADWSSWNVGSRTQWEPVKGLIMGIDVIYNRLNTAPANATGLVT